VCQVRFGKAISPRKRRSVLTVWPWTAEILQQWNEGIRPLHAAEGCPAMWPSERVPRIGLAAIDTCVSSDFRTRTLRRALDQAVDAALREDRRAP
jgi:integrase/recombinase XerC